MSLPRCCYCSHRCCWFHRSNLLRLHPSTSNWNRPWRIVPRWTSSSSQRSRPRLRDRRMIWIPSMQEVGERRGTRSYAFYPFGCSDAAHMLTQPSARFITVPRGCSLICGASSVVFPVIRDFAARVGGSTAAAADALTSDHSQTLPSVLFASIAVRFRQVLATSGAHLRPRRADTGPFGTVPQGPTTSLSVRNGAPGNGPPPTARRCDAGTRRHRPLGGATPGRAATNRSEVRRRDAPPPTARRCDAGTRRHQPLGGATPGRAAFPGLRWVCR
jgi:hypothetical protein